ncbi:MAG: prephenate dehydrogenase/arogenate dehydrogenase family protein [Firmicutes bacterium]|nr:prephenate dehydrogenase/arogenate dehydrogenase family protein [Bacillota bacterium]
MDEAHHEISLLRQTIARIDKTILSLVRKRLDTARKIGEQKKLAGAAIRDFTTEAKLIERTEKICREIGIDTELGKSLIKILFEGSIKTQHDIIESHSRGVHKKILIVGGAGRMGQWLASFLKNQGHHVYIHDISPLKPEGYHIVENLESGSKESDIIILSTPMSSSAGILDNIINTGTHAVIMDICSLKSPVYSTILKGAGEGRKIASIHPMFAPGALMLSGRILVICDCGNKTAVEEAKNLFKNTALRIVNMPLELHDRLMSVVLGMCHALNVGFINALSKTGITFNDLDTVSSTTFYKQMKTTADVALENPELYYEIQHLNAHTEKTMDILIESFKEIKTASLEDGHEKFLEIMNKGRNFFGIPEKITPDAVVD